MNSSPQIVLHISGPDRPGITSTLSEIIASEDAKLLDIGQSVLHHFLILSAIVEIPHGSDALRRILFAVSELGLKLEVSTLNPDSIKDSRPQESKRSLCVTLLGSLEDGKAVARTTQFLAEHEMNIREIQALSDGDLRGLELMVDLPERKYSQVSLQELRGKILRLGAELKVDMAVQEDTVFRRSKRLVCMDVDSTFIQMEVIDELARLAGCKDQVAAITEQAMQGQLDFKQALQERVKLLKGLEFSRARELLKDIPMSPGAETLVKVLKNLGFTIGLVSGGFDFFVNELKERFDLDFAFANQLEVVDGKITGKVIGSIVDAERKAQLIKDMAQVYRCHPEQTVAVGDGANDILMLQNAGLGIAFRAKPKLQAIADLSLNEGSLDSVLYLMGYRAQELKAILR